MHGTITPTIKKVGAQLVWRFFASVRVAVVIIALIALFAVAGTIIPQESEIPSNNAAEFYRARYGNLGTLLFQIGFTNMFSSLWFAMLLLLLATSLVICSLERVGPLYRSLKHQVIAKPIVWIKQRKLYLSFPNDPEVFAKLTAELSARKYHLFQQDGAVLAEKGRFSRFGPYVIHIGLLVVIAGAFSRLLPGWYFDTSVMVPEGITIQIPHTDFGLRNNRFQADFFQDGRPKRYQTDATIVKNGQDVLSYPIRVNHPLEYQGMQLFQQSYGDPFFVTSRVTFHKQGSHKMIGSFAVNFLQPLRTYHVGLYTIHVLNYYPDFQWKNGQPSNVSYLPHHPVFIWEVEGPTLGTGQPEVSSPLMPARANGSSQFEMQDVALNHPTVIRIHKDLGIPVVYFGCSIIMLGLIITFYFQHRRVWVLRESDMIHVGAETNKNWFAMHRELERVTKITEG